MLCDYFFLWNSYNLVTGRDGLKYQMELFLYISTYLLLLVSLLQTLNEPYHHLLLAVDPPLSFWPTFWYWNTVLSTHFHEVKNNNNISVIVETKGMSKKKEGETSKSTYLEYKGNSICVNTLKCIQETRNDLVEPNNPSRSNWIAKSSNTPSIMKEIITVSICHRMYSLFAR